MVLPPGVHLLTNLKTLAQLFMPFILIAILALNPIRVLVCSQHDSLGMSVPRL